MIYRSLADCVADLQKHGHLLRIKEQVDPYLEMAEIHRRVFQAGGPAVYFEQVKGSAYPAVSNLFGTLDRSRFILRHTFQRVKKLFQLKANPGDFFKSPLSYLDLIRLGITPLPKKVNHAPVMAHEISIHALPHIHSWPEDGGAFILLPQVYTENPDGPGIMTSNLGMYRIQLSGNEYVSNQEIGLHYQIRRDIGIHHTNARKRGEPLRVSIFVGGPPAHAFASVMYTPENLPEIAFAGALAGRRFRYKRKEQYLIAAEADFCITGTIEPTATKPEGPFGDHLGYYSLRHPFPVMKVEHVYARKNAVWPFTIVGRPPQEDTSFGKLIQELAGPMIPKEIPGVKAVHAVDAAGVHPLLLAIGSERYVPYQDRRPQELITLAHALLGYGPCSLAKYLIMVAGEDQPNLDIHDIPAYFTHFLERVDWRKDLHFQTQTTIDTLDYSGTGLNQGSKVIMVAAGEKKRQLATMLSESIRFPLEYEKPKFVMPGILALSAPAFQSYESAAAEVSLFAKSLQGSQDLSGIPLILLVDDSEFVAKDIKNFLWVCFTRSNPSHDIHGVGAFEKFKHWGCEGPLVIDARIKPHHAPPVEADPQIVKKVEALAAPGKSLHGIF